MPFFVIFSLSPVDAIVRDTDFHLLDQGKVGYLYHLQILFFNLQDSSPSDNISPSSYTLWLDLRQYINNGHAGDNNGSFGRVTKITASYDSNNNPPSSNNNNSTTMEYFIAVNDGISSATSTGQAQYDYYYSDTAVSN